MRRIIALPAASQQACRRLTANHDMHISILQYAQGKRTIPFASGQANRARGITGGTHAANARDEAMGGQLFVSYRGSQMARWGAAGGGFERGIVGPPCCKTSRPNTLQLML